MRSDKRVASFWARHRTMILVLAGVYLLLLAVLLALASGPQREPFMYQVF